MTISAMGPDLPQNVNSGG